MYIALYVSLYSPRCIGHGIRFHWVYDVPRSLAVGIQVPSGHADRHLQQGPHAREALSGMPYENGGGGREIYVPENEGVAGVSECAWECGNMSVRAFECAWECACEVREGEGGGRRGELMVEVDMQQSIMLRAISNRNQGL